MKKRSLSILLCLSLMMGMLTVSVGAANSRPAGSLEGSGVPELTVDTVAPDVSRNIALGLTASAVYSDVSSRKWSDTANNLTAEEIADVADMSKYGFTVIGARSLERHAGAAVEGVWTTGGSVGSATGAFSARADGKLYNVNGETDKNDSIYKMILTLNFGYRCVLDGLAFVHSYAGPYGYLSACDLYVSDDGESWTAVGYWDYPQRRLDGKGDYATGLKGGVLGADKTGAMLDKMYVAFDLPEGTEGKYLRIAASSMECVSPANCKNQTSYDAWSSADSISFRELMVYGEAADVNYVGVQEHTYTENETEKYDVRFIANVDDYTRYSEVGFKVTAVYENGVYAGSEKLYTDASDYVYSSLTAKEGGNIVAKSAADYHAGALMALTVKGIPVSTGKVTFQVTPYYVLKTDGAVVDAQSYEVVYNAGVYVGTTPCQSAAN